MPHVPEPMRQALAGGEARLRGPLRAFDLGDTLPKYLEGADCLQERGGLHQDCKSALNPNKL